MEGEEEQCYRDSKAGAALLLRMGMMSESTMGSWGEEVELDTTRWALVEKSFGCSPAKKQ